MWTDLDSTWTSCELRSRLIQTITRKCHSPTNLGGRTDRIVAALKARQQLKDKVDRGLDGREVLQDSKNMSSVMVEVAVESVLIKKMREREREKKVRVTLPAGETRWVRRAFSLSLDA